MTIKNLSLVTAQGNINTYLILADHNCLLDIYDITFGGNGVASYVLMYSANGANILVGNITISGSFSYALNPTYAGRIYVSGQRTIFLNASCSGYFINATSNSVVAWANTTVTGTLGGAGAKFFAGSNSTINTGGAGANAVPGVNAGTLTTGGQIS